MPINLGNLAKSVGKELIQNNQNLVSNFIKEMEEKLQNMNDIKEYTVDRFEGNIAVCEDRDTKEMLNIKKEDLPSEIKEGSILTYKDGTFSINKEKEQEVSERISQKMDNLWNN